MFEAGRPTVLSDEDMKHYMLLVGSETGQQYLLGTSLSLVEDRSESAQLSLLPEPKIDNQTVVATANLKPLVGFATQQAIRDGQTADYAERRFGN